MLDAQVAHLATSLPHPFPSPPQLGPHLSELQRNTELSLLRPACTSPIKKGTHPKGGVRFSPDTSSQPSPRRAGALSAPCQAAAQHAKPRPAMSQHGPGAASIPRPWGDRPVPWEGGQALGRSALRGTGISATARLACLPARINRGWSHRFRLGAF